jgi:hypothetical protein
MQILENEIHLEVYFYSHAYTNLARDESGYNRDIIILFNSPSTAQNIRPIMQGRRGVT